MITKEKYDEYIESLLNAARLTTKENSILINFDITDDHCVNIVEFIQQDGTKDTLKNSTFICDDDFFKYFLEKFIVAYSENMVIAFNDSVDVDSDGKYTYRVVTDDNDMMCVNGITFEYANYLMNLTKEEEKELKEMEEVIVDENGNISFLTTLLLVGAIGLSFLVMALLLS